MTERYSVDGVLRFTDYEGRRRRGMVVEIETTNDSRPVIRFNLSLAVLHNESLPNGGFTLTGRTEPTGGELVTVTVGDKGCGLITVVPF